MNIKCGLCGEDIVVADGLVNGQHVRCPYCGGKSEYQKPSRIELPAGGLTRGGGTAEKADAVASPLLSETKPRLSIIRPERSIPPSQSEPETPIRIPSPKALNPRRKSNEHPIYYSVAILVAGIAIAGIFMLNHSQRKEVMQQEELSRQREFERKEIEEQRRMAREEQDRKRQDELRKESEERQKAKEELERKRAAELAAQKAKEEASRKRREALAGIVAQVGTVSFDYWRNCPKEIRPQSVSAEKSYFCIIPKNKENADILKIVAAPEKEMSVGRYDEAGMLAPVPLDDFHAAIKQTAYLILSDDKGWICGVEKDKDGVPVTGNGSSINPAQEELGVLYDYLRMRSANVSNIDYDVYFGDQKAFRKFVRHVRFGETVSAGDVKPLIREDLQEKADAKRAGKSSKKSAFKRTVVFGNVSMIKRQIVGPTVIPYVMPAYQGFGVDYKGGRWNRDGFHQTWSRKSSNSEGTREREYLNLRAIAEKEDREETEWKMRQYSKRLTESRFEIPESEVEKVLFSGKLYFLSTR